MPMPPLLRQKVRRLHADNFSDLADTKEIVFASGVMLSDTDFRIFDAYANLTGLDLALVQNSYAYHTRLDVPEKLQVGSIQVSFRSSPYSMFVY
jgi:Zn-dependent M28 family amino/carboxypeptidase